MSMTEYTAYGFDDKESNERYNYGDKETRELISGGFNTESGIGGLRIKNGKWQFKDPRSEDSDWEDTAGGDISSLADTGSLETALADENGNILTDENDEPILAKTVFVEYAVVKDLIDRVAALESA